MRPPRKPRLSVIAAMPAVIAMTAPTIADAQQPTSPPSRIDNRTDHQERQPTEGAVCDGAGKDNIDCSRQTSQELRDIQKQIDKTDREHPADEDGQRRRSGH